MKFLKSHLNPAFFKKWELAMLLALCITLCVGVWAQGQQHELASRLIRLHVVASSDSPEDQEFKLKVRDRVLEAVTPMLDGVSDPDAARRIITENLSEIESVAAGMARERGLGAEVSATLSVESYPTREYESFSLPAGDYMSLRVVLGEGEGQNWWCVVFPPLCLASAEDAVDVNGILPEDDIGLITGEDEGYILKFRIIELWGELKSSLS